MHPESIPTAGSAVCAISPPDEPRPTRDQMMPPSGDAEYYQRHIIVLGSACGEGLGGG